jgi:hypothetical protein
MSFFETRILKTICSHWNPTAPEESSDNLNQKNGSDKLTSSACAKRSFADFEFASYHHQRVAGLDTPILTGSVWCNISLVPLTGRFVVHRTFVLFGQRSLHDIDAPGVSPRPVRIMQTGK